MSDSDPRLSTYQMVEHLVRDFDGGFDRAQVQSCVLAAISDLRGSICVEALPEMAYKLAAHRLTTRLNHAASAQVGDLVDVAHT